MKSRANDRQLLWLVFGVIGGLCLAYVWPHEHVLASATDRDAKFAICTVDVGPGSPDAVFVLDFTTGRLQGAMLSPQSQSFTNFWFANVAQDFKVGKNGKYTMMPISTPITKETDKRLQAESSMLPKSPREWSGVTDLALSMPANGCHQQHSNLLTSSRSANPSSPTTRRPSSGPPTSGRSPLGIEKASLLASGEAFSFIPITRRRLTPFFSIELIKQVA